MRALVVEVVLYEVARTAVHGDPVALKSFWDEHYGVSGLEEHVVIDEPIGIVSPEAEEQWRAFATWILQGFFFFLC